MPPQSTQNYENHRSHDPIIMFSAVLVLVSALLGAASIWFGVEMAAIAIVLASLAVLITGYKARRYAAIVQDRIIRLEMRLRLANLLTGDLQGKGETLQLSQLIGLRFASDAELPDLVRKVLAENITRADDIKRLVKNWQADYLRI